MSAGRVQTPALSIIVDREREIEKFENLPKEQKVSYQLEAIGLLRDGQDSFLKASASTILGKKPSFTIEGL